MPVLPTTAQVVCTTCGRTVSPRGHMCTEVNAHVDPSVNDWDAASWIANATREQVDALVAKGGAK